MEGSEELPIELELPIEFDQYFESFFSFAPTDPLDREFVFVDPKSYEAEIVLCKTFFKKVWEGAKKAVKQIGKGIKKVAEKVADVAKKALEEAAEALKKIAELIAHVTKKATEKVTDFVKEHKKETLIAAAVITAIMGAFLATGALGSAAAVAKPSGRKKEGEEDDPVDPPLQALPTEPTWIKEIFSNGSDLSLKETHDAWDSFATLKSETENLWASVQGVQPEFNASLHTVNDLLNRIAPQAADVGLPQELLSSTDRWKEFIRKGHEKIDQDFHSYRMAQIPPPVIPSFQTQDVSPLTNFAHIIRHGLEIIGRGMSEPQLLNPDSPLNQFIPTAPADQTIASFFKNMETTLAQETEAFRVQFRNAPEEITPSSFLEKMLGTIQHSNETLIEAPHPTRSIAFHTEGVTQDDMLITFINGMGNSFEDATNNINHIKALSPGNLRIDGVYNHSNTPPVDLAEILALNSIGQSPVTARLLTEKWTNFHEKNKDNPHAKILHFCHSQGCFHTKNTLEKLSQEIRDRLIVVAIAPACIVPTELCFRSFNYASDKDIVPYGEVMLKHFLIAFNHEDDQHELLVALKELRDQLMILESHEGATGINHDFQSQTFNEKIKQELEDYFKKKGKYK